MSFNVKYRDKSGAISHKIIEAESRYECIDQCKKDNINPIEISLIKLTSKGSANNSIFSYNRYLISFFIFVALSTIIYFFVSSKARNKNVIITPTKKQSISTNILKQVETKSAIHPSVRTNANVSKEKISTPRNRGKVKAAIPAGRIDKIIDSDGNVRYIRRKSTPFTNRVDSLIWAAIRPAGFPVGLRQWVKHHSHSELVTALKSPMNYDENDSLEVKELKKHIDDVKAQVLSSLNKGHSIEEVLSEIEMSVSEERKLIARSQKILKDLATEGDYQAISEYVEIANEDLAAKGLRQLHLPKKFKQEEQEQLHQ